MSEAGCSENPIMWLTSHLNSATQLSLKTKCQSIWSSYDFFQLYWDKIYNNKSIICKSNQPNDWTAEWMSRQLRYDRHWHQASQCECKASVMVRGPPAIVPWSPIEGGPGHWLVGQLMEDLHDYPKEGGPGYPGSGAVVSGQGLSLAGNQSWGSGTVRGHRLGWGTLPPSAWI